MFQRGKKKKSKLICGQNKTKQESKEKNEYFIPIATLLLLCL